MSDELYSVYVPVHLINPRYYIEPSWKLIATAKNKKQANKIAEMAAEVNGIPVETLWIREPGEEVGFSDEQ